MDLNAVDVKIAPWILLGVVWFITAFTTKRTQAKESLASRLSYVVPAIAGGALMWSRVSILPFLDVVIVPASDASLCGGTALAVAGVAFALWARFHLGRNWSGNVTLKQDHKLITTGPYALARHPIYTGLLGGLVGSMISIGTVRAFAGWAVIVAAFVYKLSTEEKLMRTHFGGEHAAWSQRTKRLVPFLW